MDLCNYVRQVPHKHFMVILNLVIFQYSVDVWYKHWRYFKCTVPGSSWGWNCPASILETAQGTVNDNFVQYST